MKGTEEQKQCKREGESMLGTNSWKELFVLLRIGCGQTVRRTSGDSHICSRGIGQFLNSADIFLCRSMNSSTFTGMRGGDIVLRSLLFHFIVSHERENQST